MLTHSTRYERPSTLDEALSLLDQYPEQLEVIAGGTDVVVHIRIGKRSPRGLLDITRIQELRGIDLTADKQRLDIGSATTVAEVCQSTAVAEYLPLLAAAARELGSVQIRNRATIGGNLANASPAGDTICALLALDAELLLGSARGTRVVPIHDFFRGPALTALEPQELILRIMVPLRVWEGRVVQQYQKVGSRSAMVCAVASLAALTVSREGVVQYCAYAAGSVAPTCVRVSTVEESVRGRPLSADMCEMAAEQIQSDIRPIDDLRGSAQYRRMVMSNLMRAHLLGCLDHPE